MALTTRVVVAALFFGSIDVANSVRDARAALDHTPVYLPYFPVVANLLLGVGLLVGLLAVPLALPVKLLSCVSDALLAGWLAGDTRLSPAVRTRGAWLYATCPLSIVLVSLHGQWDALWLLPMVVALAVAGGADRPRSARTAGALGALAAVAVLFKPVPAALLPAVVPSIRRLPWRTWVASATSTVAAFAVVLGASLAWFAHEGFDIGTVLSTIKDYGATARTVVVMGPARLAEDPGGLPSGLGLAVEDYRRLGIVVAGLVLLRYQLRPERQDRLTTAAVVCLVLQAIGGVAPQYLLWPLPFVVASGRLRAARWYAASTSLLLLAYYLIPGASVVAGENGGLFDPLSGVSWLTPPAAVLDLFDGERLLRAWRWFANGVVPAGLLAFGVWLLRQPRQAANGPAPAAEGTTGGGLRRGLVWVAPPSAVVVVCAALWVLLPPGDGGGRMDRVLPDRLEAYAAVPPTLGAGPAAPPRGGPWPLSAPVLLAAATLGWAAATARRPVAVHAEPVREPLPVA